MTEKIKIFLIDDDKLDLSISEKLIQSNSAFEFMGSTTLPEKAIEFVNKVKPDIVLLDIEMPNKNGFEIAKYFKNTGIHIVFLTSHSNFALDAFKTLAIHYIQKPIKKEDLESIAIRYKNLKNKFNLSQQEQIDELILQFTAKPNFVEKIKLQHTNEIELLPVNDIVYFENNNEETIIHLQNKSKKVAFKNIEEYRKILANNTNFKRATDNFIINNNFLKSISLKENTSILHFSNNKDLDLNCLQSESWYEKLI